MEWLTDRRFGRAWAWNWKYSEWKLIVGSEEKIGSFQG
jgi:hypothetical protein